MARYGLPNPTRGVMSLSRASKMDIDKTNPAQSKSSFATPASKSALPKDTGMTPHKLGVKTQRIKQVAKTAMGK